MLNARSPLEQSPSSSTTAGADMIGGAGTQSNTDTDAVCVIGSAESKWMYTPQARLRYPSPTEMAP